MVVVLLLLLLLLPVPKCSGCDAVGDGGIPAATAAVAVAAAHAGAQELGDPRQQYTLEMAMTTIQCFLAIKLIHDNIGNTAEYFSFEYSVNTQSDIDIVFIAIYNNTNIQKI